MAGTSRSGRKPKPTRLKVLDGNPGKRRLSKNEPKPRPVRPTCPGWLEPEAAAEWRRVAPELERLGLLTILDRAALSIYCQAWADYRYAREVLRSTGRTMLSKRSSCTRQRPEVVTAQHAAQLVRAFCSEFGLTPSSRGRMELPNEDALDDMGGLLD